MSVVYSIPLTEEHAVETYAQQRTRQKSLLWLAWPMKILCALGLLALMSVGIFAQIPVVTGISAFFLLLLAVGPRFDYWLMRRRWRRHPQFNEVLRIEITDSGLSFATPKSSGTTLWSAYTKAVERRSGVLLYAGSWDYLWLPDKALIAGSAAEARDLMKANLSMQPNPQVSPSAARSDVAPSMKRVIPPWHFPANHWLSRTLQIVWGIALASSIWASATGRVGLVRVLGYSTGVIALVWAAHFGWQVLQRRRARES